MQRQEAINHIKFQLGAYDGVVGVQVELSDNFFNTAVDRALLWLSVYAPRKEVVNLIMRAGEKSIDLSYLPANAEVVEVRRSGNSVAKTPLWYAGLLNDFYASDLNITDFVYFLNWSGTVRKVLGTEFTWEYRKPFLYISPVPTTEEVLEVEYVMPYADVSEVPFKYLDAFLMYATAVAKEMLGRIRSKYSGVPAPEGQIQLDGERLIDEARDMYQQAEDKLKRLVPAGGILVG